MARHSLVVLLSSTLNDLKQHRQTVRDALDGLGFDLVVMESRGASARTTAEECRRWVREADVLVGILGMKYGTQDKASQLSFTEIEFREARSAGKPCLMYLMDEEKHRLAPRLVDVGDEARRLALFKRHVVEAVTVSRFTSPDNLAHKVLRDLTLMAAEEGWTRREAAPEVREKAPPPTAPNALELPLDSWDSKRFRLLLDDLGDESRVDIAAGLIAGMFNRGDFSILKRLVSIDRPVWDRMSLFLRSLPISQDRLAIEILQSSDPFYLRLLTMIAGETSASTCTEAIAARLLVDGKEIDETLRGYRHSMRSFREVVQDALGNMPLADVPLLERFREKARGRRWQAYGTFSKAIKQIQRRAQHVI